MSGEGPGRRSQFLEILDARGLYRSLHRAEVMVVTLTEVYVRRDPSRDPPARRTAMSLGEYVKHKGLFGLVRGDGDVDVHFNQVGYAFDAPLCGQARAGVQRSSRQPVATRPTTPVRQDNPMLRSRFAGRQGGSLRASRTRSEFAARISIRVRARKGRDVHSPLQAYWPD